MAPTPTCSSINALTQFVHCTTLAHHVHDYLDQVHTNLVQAIGRGACPNVVITNAKHMTLNLLRDQVCLLADISKCFEAIPITPNDPEGLPQALNWMVTTSFQAICCCTPCECILSCLYHQNPKDSSNHYGKPILSS
jgi:hypothetical protein